MADNSKMILNLFTQLQNQLFYDDNIDQGEFVSFMQPGQFVSLNLTQQAYSDDMAIQAAISDVLLDTSFVNKYQDINNSGSAELPSTLSQVYYNVMEHAALPAKELTSDVLAQIAQLQKWLAANIDNYSKYQDLYNNVVTALIEEQHKPSPDPVIINTLKNQKSQAYSHWVIIGQKQTYESNYAQYTYLNSENPVTFWNDLKTQMEQAKQTSANFGDYYPVMFEPPISEWNNDGPWTQSTAIADDTSSYQYAKETAWSGGLSVGWGLWSFGGGASGSTSYSYQQSDVSNVTLSFEYMRVSLNRSAWFRPDAFGYHFWTWQKAFGGEILSDGGNLAANPPLRPVGKMPVLPEYLILVRNLELTANFSEQDKETYSKMIQGSMSFGWGPFSINGSYQEGENSVSVKSTFDGVTIKVTQPQIIARASTFLPKSPDPNVALDWQSDACLPGNPCWGSGTALVNTARKKDFEKLLLDAEAIALSEKAEQLKNLWITHNLATKIVKAKKS